ncbi:MAG: hypothetical protein HYT79_09125 [Elusimicrobia bacterium]|nr:hypothetical protein [Elusimicrobiota bacterium]
MSRFLLMAAIAIAASGAAAEKTDPRVGPVLESGSRWVETTDKKIMIFAPKEWRLKPPTDTHAVLTLEHEAPPGAILTIRKLSSTGEGSPSPFAAAETYYETLRQRDPPLQEAKSRLPNGHEIRHLVYKDKIEGALVWNNSLPYGFTAIPSPKAPWNDIRNLLGTISDPRDDAFRTTPKPQPRRLAAGDWTAAVDHSWMIQANKEGWTAETPQNEDLIFLTGSFETSLLNVTIGKEPPNPEPPDTRLAHWGETLGAKSKAPIILGLPNEARLRYYSSPDQTELIGHLEYRNNIYIVNAYGQPTIDFQEMKRLLGSISDPNPTLLAKTTQAAELPAPPGAPTSWSEAQQQALANLPQPDPRIKAIVEKYSVYLMVAAVLLGGGYVVFLRLNDQRLLKFGEEFASGQEGSKLELLAGGWYLTLFPTVVVYAPGGLRLAAHYRKPPMLQAVIAIYLLRWAALYMGVSNILLIALSVLLVIFSVLLGVTIGWSIRGTPCWIYDDKGHVAFKIKRKMGLLAYRFVVTDANKETLGFLKMSSLSNFIRKQWWILDVKGNVVGHVIEDSIAKSIARRFIGHLWGLFRADFNVMAQGKTIGAIKSTRSPFNRMKLSAQLPPNLDPRMLFACLVGINIFDRDRWYPFWSS